MPLRSYKISNWHCTRLYHLVLEVFALCRGFCSAALDIWTILQSDVPSREALTTFRRHLISHFFHSDFATAYSDPSQRL